MVPQISIIIPVFNEEKNIQLLYERLIKTLNEIVKTYEIIFINDGSRDNTLQIIKKINKKNRAVKAISFSRNFGHMSAVDAGIKASKGKKTVLMDADLQDPPELIEKLYKKSLEGFDIVYAIKTKRQEGPIRNFLFTKYYLLLNKLSSYHMPEHAGTFSIMDRKIVDILANLDERNKYFSGLRAWAGFSQIGILYKRPKRHAGKPASMRRLIKLGLDGIFSFSYLPLRFASILGFIFASVAFLFILVVLYARFFLGYGLIGWASTMSSILLIGGVQLITLGIIGEYLARIYDEVKHRPNFIIAEKIGFGKK